MRQRLNSPAEALGDNKVLIEALICKIKGFELKPEISNFSSLLPRQASVLHQNKDPAF